MGFLRRLLPSDVDDLVGTLARVIRTGDPAARSEVARTGMAALLSPVDLVLSTVERGRYRRAGAPDLPVVFVCGPARSGTSLTAQVLIRQLPVSYFSNVVGLFPRSPVTATRLFRRKLRRSELSFRSFYGKSQGLAGPNDALHLWDRWFGTERNTAPPPPSAAARSAMVRFFGSWQQAWPVPLVAKNNRLYVYGDVVARALPTAHFVCLQRDPVYLAQSQLVARRVVLGRDDVPYGIRSQEYERLARPDQPLEDACAYVVAERQVATRTRDIIGDARFWLVSYEQFCADPNRLLAKLSDEVLGAPYRPLAPDELSSIQVSSQQTVSDEEFARIVAACRSLGIADDRDEYFP